MGEATSVAADSAQPAYKLAAKDVSSVSDPVA
jgi:hypothetical protein